MCVNLRRTLRAIYALIFSNYGRVKAQWGGAFVCVIFQLLQRCWLQNSIFAQRRGQSSRFEKAFCLSAAFWARSLVRNWPLPCSKKHVPRQTEPYSGANAPNSGRLRVRYDYFLVPRIPLMNPARAPNERPQRDAVWGASARRQKSAAEFSSVPHANYYARAGNCVGNYTAESDNGSASLFRILIPRLNGSTTRCSNESRRSWNN